MIRKPDKRLFEIALMKSGLTSDKVWYCGDRYSNDVVGANNAGIFPVYYSEMCIRDRYFFTVGIIGKLNLSVVTAVCLNVIYIFVAVQPDTDALHIH